MKTYKINLKTYSGTLTPFQADTIFGHLCWVVAQKAGDKELGKFLEPFKEGKPPFVISDGFPDTLLPKPLSVEFNIDKPEERKEWKKVNFLNFNDFNSVRLGEKCERKISESYMTTFTTPHSAISRLTNATLAEGGLYSLREMNIPNVTIEHNAWSPGFICIQLCVRKCRPVIRAGGYDGGAFPASFACRITGFFVIIFWTFVDNRIIRMAVRTGEPDLVPVSRSYKFRFTYVFCH